MKLGDQQHTVTLANPGPPVPDGDGGFRQPLIPLTPGTMLTAIRTASGRDLERLAAGTTIAKNALVLTMRYHAQITTKTVVTFRGRILNVVNVTNTDERGIESVLLCVEVVA